MKYEKSKLIFYSFLFVNAIVFSEQLVDFDSIIKRINENDPLYHILDLSEFKKLVSVQQEKLIKALDHNRFVGHVKWHAELDSSLKRFRGIIEEILIENNFNYRRFPSDFIHGLLSLHVYETNMHDRENVLFKDQYGTKIVDYQKKLNDWKIEEKFNDLKSSGFYAVLYIKEETKQFILAFKGTDPKSINDIKADLSEVAGNRLGKQSYQCRIAIQTAINSAKELGYELSVTGHSLGAYLAELSVIYAHEDFNYSEIKAVTFESPGVKEIVESFNDKNNVINFRNWVNAYKYDIVTYLHDPNIINTANGHCGRIIHLKSEEFNSQVGFLEWIKNIPIMYKLRKALDLDAHGISGILDEFDLDMESPKHTNRVVEILNWPKKLQVLNFHGKDLNDPKENFELKYESQYNAFEFDGIRQDLLNEKFEQTDDYYLRKLTEKNLLECVDDDLIIRQLKRLKYTFQISDTKKGLLLTSNVPNLNIHEIREIMNRLRKVTGTYLFDFLLFNGACRTLKYEIAGRLFIRDKILNVKSSIYIERSYIEIIKRLYLTEQFVWLQGPPGMGKTTLALNFAESIEKHFNRRWINSESPMTIKEEMLEMAKEIGFSQNAKTKIDLRISSEILVSEISNFIRKHYTEKFFFIFDNLNELDDDIINIFITLKKNYNLKFLLTTRNNLLHSKADFIHKNNKIEVSYFSKNEQTIYWEKCLEKYIDSEMNKKDINLLLSNFPCLMEKVRPYQINMMRISLISFKENDVLLRVKEYFEKLCSKTSEFRLADPLLNYLMKSESKVSWQIIQYSAFLNSDFIDIKIIEQVLNVSRYNLSQSISFLERLGLLSLQRKYDMVGFRIFHQNFQLETRKFLDSCSDIQCLGKKNIILNLIKALHVVLPNINLIMDELRITQTNQNEIKPSLKDLLTNSFWRFFGFAIPLAIYSTFEEQYKIIPIFSKKSILQINLLLEDLYQFKLKLTREEIIESNLIPLIRNLIVMFEYAASVSFIYDFRLENLKLLSNDLCSIVGNAHCTKMFVEGVIN